MLSERIGRLRPSATLRLADRAKQLTREGRDIISLSVGEPDFPTPGFIKEAAAEALQEGVTGYTDTSGIHGLRDALAEKLRRENGIDASADDVLVTPGAKFAIYLAFQTLVNEGDRVVIVDPAWVSFEAIAELVGAEVVKCPAGPDLLPDGEQFAELIDGASLAIINSPCNPTGAVYPENRVRAMVEAAEDTGAYVLSDEVYEKIVYEGSHYSPASEHGNVITINGFSKAYSMTGWRLGYVHAPDDVLGGMKRLQSHSTTCANSFAQMGALAALRQRERGQAAVEKMVRSFRERRNYLVEALNDVPGMDCVEPHGAFYAFPSYDLDMGSFDLSDELLRNGVAVTPGAAFGPTGENHLRISYAVSEDRLHEAVNRIRSTLEELS